MFATKTTGGGAPGSGRKKAVGSNSFVDESLFGSKPRKQATPRRSAQSSAASNAKDQSHTTDSMRDGGGNRNQTQRGGSGPRYGRRAGGPETIDIVTKDMVRTIIVPQRDAAAGPAVLTLHRDEFERIRRAAVVRTASARAKDAATRKQERLDKEAESYMRREQLTRLDRTKRSDEPMNELDREAKEQKEYLLTRARLQMEDQEDDIKKLNQMIIGAKCHAIRDAQIAEKGQLKSMYKEEELRLDQIMEEERVKGIAAQEQKERKLREQRAKGAAGIRDQIEEREQLKLIEQELLDQESQAMVAEVQRLVLEDEKKALRKAENTTELMKMVASSNALALEHKAMVKEAERQEDLRVVEYMKAKAEREAEVFAEKERVAKEKEMETARLRSLQERANDTQAEKDALKAKRQQEAVERALRKREYEEAEKKRVMMEKIQLERDEQVAHKQRFLAMQMHQERADFERVLQAQEELIHAEEVVHAKKADTRKTHVKEVQTQIRGKEAERLEERREFFAEGVRLNQEMAARKERLEEIKQRKLLELQSAGIGDQYCHSVKRAVQKT